MSIVKDYFDDQQVKVMSGHGGGKSFLREMVAKLHVPTPLVEDGPEVINMWIDEMAGGGCAYVPRATLMACTVQSLFSHGLPYGWPR